MVGVSQILEEEKQGLGEAALWSEKRGVVSHHLEGLPRAHRLVEKEAGAGRGGRGGVVGWASLVAQWLRIHLAMLGTQV